MILVDTSVWIEFFKQKEPFKATVQSLLKSQMALSIEPVFAELLYGVRRRLLTVLMNTKKDLGSTIAM